MKINRLVLISAGVSLALVSPLLAQAAKEQPKPAAKPAMAAKPAASSEAADPALEAQVKARVAEYWKQRMTLNLGSILPYYENSFRASFTPEKFAVDFRRLNRFNPEFLGVDGVKLDSPTKATVKVKLRTKPSVLEGAELVSSTEETWVLENGQWFKAAETMIPNI